MIFGQKNTDKPAVKTAAPGADIFDSTTATFEADVLQASMDTPIIVDFWAPWCGPCKQLGPVLEAAVMGAKGKVRLAKINIDENPELAQALRVQSIPTVFAFFQGQPVTGFAGARPGSEIKALIEQLIKLGQQAKPETMNIPEALSGAGVLLAESKITEAQALYLKILEQDETNALAYAGLIRCFIAVGEIEQAQGMIDHAPDGIAGHAALDAVRAALELSAKSPGETALQDLSGTVEKNPDDHQKRLDYALALFAAGQKSEAVDQLIEIIRRDRVNEKKWEDDKARLQLLQFFDAMGHAAPETLAGRRKLSSLLFS